MKSRFKVGDKLKASSFDREEYGIEYVVITSINEKNRIYHWEARGHNISIGGVFHSGYSFDEAKEYVE